MLDEISAEALLADEPAQRIVMLFADAETQAALEAWAVAQGFDLSRSHGGDELLTGQFEFHCTLFASANDISLPVGEWEIDPVTLYACGFDILGKDADTPVLLVDAAADLIEDRDNIIEETGAEPTFADWLPHVSLSYAWNGNPDLGAISPPDFALTFDTIVVGEFETKGATAMLNFTIGQAAARKGRRPSALRSDLPPEVQELYDQLAALDRQGAETFRQVIAEAHSFSAEFDTLWEEYYEAANEAGIVPPLPPVECADYTEFAERYA